MSYKGIFEDSDESESGEDFSASEEDWKPGKGDVSSDEDEEVDLSENSEDDDEGPSQGKKSKNSKSKATKNNRNAAAKVRQTASLRSKLFRRYNPPPKTASTSKSPVPTKVAEILSNSQYKRRQQISSASNPRAVLSDSDSSDGEGLVNPNDIDFNSEFFDVKAKDTAEQQPVENGAPVFDCNAGMNLSDSSDEDNADFDEVPAETSTSSAKTKSLVNQINKKSSNEMHDFSSLQDFAKNLETAKAHLEKLKQKEKGTSKANTDESDVTRLLSLGEGATTSGTPSRKRKQKDGHSDESDWENVSDDEALAKSQEIKDIQITVGNENTRNISREQKRIIDLEACLKRRMNRDIKERQVFLHKTAVLCWIAHGNYINRVLNNMTLMEMCIKLLPSKNAYPKGDTDVKYYHMVTDWFHSVFALKSDKLYCDLKKLPPRTLSLALQIRSKQIISKCDFVLLFVTMLRSLGIQCRLVINFAVPPLRPPQKDLYVVSTKPKEAEETTSKGKGKDTSKTVAKKIKASTEKMKASPSDKTTKSNGKVSEKSSTAKTSKVAKVASQPTDHDYIESCKKVKVKVTQMSREFIEKNTAEPMTPKRKRETASPLPQSPATKPKKAKTEPSNSQPSGSQRINNHSPKIIANGKRAMSKEIDIAVSPKVKSKKKHTNQNDEPSQVLVGTPIKHKVIQRTNSAAAPPNLARLKGIQSKDETKAAPFSPRKTRSKSSQSNETTNHTSKAKLKLKLPQLDGADDIATKDKKRTKTKVRSKQDDSSEDSDFAPAPPKRIRTKTAPQKPVNKLLSKAKQVDRRVFSTDEETEEDKNTVRMNFWVEAYAEKEKKWVVIDPVKKKVDSVEYVKKNASKPIIYVLAWNNDNTIRDVTPRYCSQFHTSTRKLRAEQLWIDDTLDKYLEQRNPRTIIEDVEFSKLHMDTPMPTSINEFKNHPLYALERHLLKFEAIYPRNALTLGYIRNEPIFARECVHTLHSREIWVKQARTVKVGEKPYKIVKARPKWNRLLNQMEDAKPLEIFGFWQTEPYKPPVAENGIVPRNPYGNVELFKPEMLPIGTRHIQLPNLNRVCKKMGVDCAQAVIGFDFHGGSSHPTFDGFVVCEEFADDVIAQWEVEQEEQIRKETEKREARVYGNWKKLIKGLLIRERLKRKYGTEEKTEKSHGKKGKKN